MDQIQDIYENYEIDDEKQIKNYGKRKYTSTSRLKFKFLLYCLLIAFFLLLPFCTLFVKIFFNFFLFFFKYYYKNLYL